MRQRRGWSSGAFSTLSPSLFIKLALAVLGVYLERAN